MFEIPHVQPRDETKTACGSSDAFNLAWSPMPEASFRAERVRQAGYASSHAYTIEEFGLTRACVVERLGDVMDQHGFGR